MARGKFNFCDLVSMIVCDDNNSQRGKGRRGLMFV